MTRRDGAYPTLAMSWKGVSELLFRFGLIALLAGCAGTGNRDGAPDETPDLSNIDDAVPRVEPKSKYGNPKSYVVFGKRYYTKDSAIGHVERGTASWYGKKFHGRRTSSGERYDMYAMTAAHKSLPLPSYARVTNLENGRSAVVRVNDRGPFHGRRVIDLSYAAAHKLGVVRQGTALVEVRTIDPARADRPAGSENLFATVDPAIASKRKATKTQPTPAIAVAPTPKPATKPVQIAINSLEGKHNAAAAKKPDGAPTAKPEHEPKLAATGQGSRGSKASNTFLQVGAFGNRSNAEQLRRQLLDNLAENVYVRTADGGKAPLYKVRVGPLASPSKAKDVSQKLAALGLTESHVVVE